MPALPKEALVAGEVLQFLCIGVGGTGAKSPGSGTKDLLERNRLHKI
jgi:hypothetical protein